MNNKTYNFLEKKEDPTLYKVYPPLMHPILEAITMSITAITITILAKKAISSVLKHK